jgi:hypothetical protein
VEQRLRAGRHHSVVNAISQEDFPHKRRHRIVQPELVRNGVVSAS